MCLAIWTTETLTDLSPEDLWRNPVRSIRAFSYLDNGNLDWLEDGPGRGKQQQQQQPDWLVTRGSMAESGEINSCVQLSGQRKPWLTWRRTWSWQTTTTTTTRLTCHQRIYGGIRWNQFVRSAIWTTETLTDLKTDLVVANNNNNNNPTDLSPEDLWRNPVKSIRAFSYLDNGNLDWLEDGPGRGKQQQQQQQPDWLVTRGSMAESGEINSCVQLSGQRKPWLTWRRTWSWQTTTTTTRLICHQRIYGGIRWDQFVRSAIWTTEPWLTWRRTWSWQTTTTTSTRLTCHQRIYGGIRWNQFVRSAISTMETLTDLKTDLVVANNNNNINPTDLSPEDLWRNPVRLIRAFSYLDNGNLDWLEDGSGRGKQQQQQQPDWLVTRGSMAESGEINSCVQLSGQRKPWLTWRRTWLWQTTTTTTTRLTCHQRIYGGIRWDQFVRLAIWTTETLTDLKTDLVVANNNNNPTDLSPEDLWRNPVKSIRAFSYLDNGNLDWLEDGPGRGKQQQQQQPDWLVTRGSMAESGEINSCVQLSGQRKPWLTWRRTWSWQTTTTTRLTCHQRIYGGIRWDQFVRSAISTMETLTDLKTDLVVANNNNNHINPTDLSPEDLWRNPVKSIRAFSYLDNGNLDWLEDGPGRGKQQQQPHQPDWLVTRGSMAESGEINSCVQLSGQRKPWLTRRRTWSWQTTTTTTTRLTCHQRLYGGIRWNQFVRSAIWTTETLTHLKTDLVVANNNNNNNPTDLSPEDLWRNPVKSIRAFSYLDNGNLDSLEDGPGRGKQQPDWLVTRGSMAESGEINSCVQLSGQRKPWLTWRRTWSWQTTTTTTTRLTCHQRIYGGIRWNQFVRSAIWTTETLTDLKTDLVVANNNNNPTDLSPEDLWRNPVKSIRAFSYLDNGNLDWLEDGTGRGKQQQQQPDWLVTRGSMTESGGINSCVQLSRQWKPWLTWRRTWSWQTTTTTTSTRLTCHQRIYGRIRWNQFVRSAISTMETLTDLKTDLVVANNNNNHINPTDLSPEDLWRNPVRSIRAFSYLDNGNLDWLEDGPGRGKQQQQPDWLVTRGYMAESGEINSCVQLSGQRKPWLTWRRTWSWQTTTTTRLTCHQRIYGGIRWNQFVRSAIWTTETLTHLKTDLVVANNNNNNNNNNPTDLSPEDLWRNPVKSIRAFSYLDNGNLDSLEDGPGRGKQQPDWLVTRGSMAESGEINSCVQLSGQRKPWLTWRRTWSWQTTTTTTRLTCHQRIYGGIRWNQFVRSAIWTTETLTDLKTDLVVANNNNNNNPTDLSPEDLWRNPVKSIRAFSYLDNGNLDWLEDGPGRGKQQQQQPDWLVTRGSMAESGGINSCVQLSRQWKPWLTWRRTWSWQTTTTTTTRLTCHQRIYGGIRWDQFVRSAIWTTETLTDLKTDLVVANNNNNNNPTDLSPEDLWRIRWNQFD